MTRKKYLKKRMRGKEQGSLGDSTKLLNSDISEHKWYEKVGIGRSFSRFVNQVNQRVKVQEVM